MLRLLSRRILSYLGRRRSESELDEEIRIHLEMAIDENVAMWSSPRSVTGINAVYRSSIR